MRHVQTLLAIKVHAVLQGAVAVEGEAMLWKRTAVPVKLQRTSSQQLPGHANPAQPGQPKASSHQEASSSRSQPSAGGQDRSQAKTVGPAPIGASVSPGTQQEGRQPGQQTAAGPGSTSEPGSSSQPGPASAGRPTLPDAQVGTSSSVRAHSSNLFKEAEGSMRFFMWHKDQKAVSHCLTAILQMART